jgi:hypothetical protein
MLRRHPHYAMHNVIADSVRKDFRQFVYLVWQQINLPEPTPLQYDIAHFYSTAQTRSVLRRFEEWVSPSSPLPTSVGNCSTILRRRFWLSQPLRTGLTTSLPLPYSLSVRCRSYSTLHQGLNRGLAGLSSMLDRLQQISHPQFALWYHLADRWFSR